MEENTDKRSPSRTATVSDILKLVVADYEAKNLSSIKALGYGVRRLEQFFQGKLADYVKHGDVLAYIAQRKADGAAPATIAMELGFLRRAYKLGHIAEMVSRIPNIPVLRFDNKRHEFVEPEEFERVCADAKRHYVRPYMFAYFYGWPRGEIFPLRRTNFDPAERVIRFKPVNSNKPERLVRLAGKGLEVVLEAYAYSGALEGRFLFCEKDGTEICRATYDVWLKSVSNYGRIFGDVRRTAKRNGVDPANQFPERIANAASAAVTDDTFEELADLGVL